MNGFFSKKTIVTILVAVLIALTLAILSAVSGGKISPVGSLLNIIAKPFQSAGTSISNFFEDKANRSLRYDEMEKENAELKQRIAGLEAELRERDSMESENKQLRAALGLRNKNASMTFEDAEIVAKNSDNWSRTFTINKGSNSGIEVNDCVIVAEGMIGYVSEVGANWATVTAVTDTTMEAAAIASRTRDVASAEGDFELMSDGKFRLSYLSKDTQIREGDVIETSGVGDLFPKGIVLGRVVEVRTESHGIAKYAVVAPVCDLDCVNHVMVITSFAEEEGV